MRNVIRLFKETWRGLLITLLVFVILFLTLVFVILFLAYYRNIDDCVRAFEYTYQQCAFLVRNHLPIR